MNDQPSPGQRPGSSVGHDLSIDPSADLSADPGADPGAARSGREAAPGMLRGPGVDHAAGLGSGSRTRGRDGTAVPSGEVRDYYGKPVIKAPAWAARDIAGYFFLGGLAGAGSVLAAAAHRTSRPATATALKVSSLGAVSLATAALIHDLGRPDRFASMLRVVKLTSPMSVGSWLLAAYGPPAGVAALSAVTGRLPRIGATATAAAGLLGPAVATYTAVLAADTAVPAWNGIHRELPYLFAASATTAAAGMALVGGPAREAGPARAAAVLGAAAELTAERAAERRLAAQPAPSTDHPDGTVADALQRGRAGRLLRAARVLTATGAATAAVAGGRRRAVGAAGGVALLLGAACTRFGIFAAGMASAEDPRYTVGPQRARIADRNRQAEAESTDAGQRVAVG